MKNILNFNKAVLRNYSCILLVFFLPINQKISSGLIIIATIFTLVDYKNLDISRLKKNWPLIFFYLSYVVIGSLIRDVFLIKHLEYKLSFIFMPLIFHNHAEKDFRIFVKAFVFGLLSFYFILWIQALNSSFTYNQFNFNYKVFENSYGFIESGIKGGNFFLGEYFTKHLQTSYFSLYYCFGILLLIYLKPFQGKINVIINLLFVFAVIQSLSKAGMLLLFISVMFLSYSQLKKRKWIIIIITPLLFSLIYILNPRVSKLVDNTLKNGVQFKIRSPESLDMRLLTWKASLKIINRKPIIGYGVKEAQIELNKIYVINKYRFPLIYRLNSHNLYLQTAIEGGVLLLLIFIMLQALLFYRFGCTELILGFTILCSISFMFESYFSRYLGISFFALFYSLILNFYESKKQ